MADEQLCAPPNIQLRGSRHAVRRTIDRDDKPVVEDIQETVEDDMKMVAETKVPHPYEMTEVPHPSKTKALNTT